MNEKKRQELPKPINLDDLYSCQEERENESKEKIENIDLNLIDDFNNHPFKVQNNEELQQLKNSIKTNGILSPILIRPKGNRYEMISGHRRKFAVLNFDYPEDPDAEYNHGTYNIPLNYHSDEWQMFTETYVTEADYSSIDLSVLSVHEINNIYVTNFSLVKDLGNYTYNYDEQGNLINTVDSLNNEENFKFDKNNQLISEFNPKGNNFKYEYDNIKKSRILKGISPTGISNEYKYDSFGNVYKTVINNVNPKGKEINGNYFIRLKGTNKYIAHDMHSSKVFLKEDTCSHYSYKLEKKSVDNNIDIYNMASTILPTYILSKSGEVLNIVRNGIPADLELISKDNGSYNIKIHNEELYFKYENEELILSPLKDDEAFEFYFEDIDTKEFVETKATYTDDGKYISEIEDALSNKTIYNVDSDKGLINSVINPKGVETKYLYNNQEQLISMETDNKIIEYTYKNSLIKEIKTGNKLFTFDYDNFLNNLNVKLNGQILVANEYLGNNGLLKSITYGNGQKINYEYDDFYRIQQFNNYYYMYNNLGLLSQINVQNNVYEKYYYDYAKRLNSYIYLDKYKINYKYDKDSNINHKDFNLYDYSYKIDYDFNEDDSVVKMIFDNNSLNYNYDYLGRLQSKDINGNIPQYFTYKKNGNKTSFLVSSMKIGNDDFTYSYDSLYNITKILKNGEIINSFTYDNRNHLLIDENHELNIKYVYTYDNEGNILTREQYDLETNILLNTDTFMYENSEWEDQLTKYNNETITYDAIGNPLSIGSKELTWKNGRQLSSYKDGNFEVKYYYNQNGIRTTKNFSDGGNINYYLEGNAIIFEERNSINNGIKQTDMLYYIYDDSGNILGFKCNDASYYYQKNYQNDITGIYDSNYNLVVSYKYDDWGNIISLNDTTTNHIGTVNPFRYRSYYYDEDTDLYYLNTRYYNPKFGRFINADGYAATGQGIEDSNLYLYCGNNFVNAIDYSGQFWGAVCNFVKTVASGVAKTVAKLAPKYVAEAGVAAVDGPLPIGDVIAVASSLIFLYQDLPKLAESLTSAISEIQISPANNTDEVQGTKIYRFGGKNPGNLVPRKSDIDCDHPGLSFTTKKPYGRQAVVTTIEEINATGIVKAVKDGKNHVSILPIGGTVDDWNKAGADSIWTEAVRSVVVKWDGVS